MPFFFRDAPPLQPRTVAKASFSWPEHADDKYFQYQVVVSVAAVDAASRLTITLKRGLITVEDDNGEVLPVSVGTDVLVGLLLVSHFDVWVNMRNGATVPYTLPLENVPKEGAHWVLQVPHPYTEIDLVQLHDTLRVDLYVARS